MKNLQVVKNEMKNEILIVDLNKGEEVEIMGVGVDLNNPQVVVMAMREGLILKEEGKPYLFNKFQHPTVTQPIYVNYVDDNGEGASNYTYLSGEDADKYIKQYWSIVSANAEELLTTNITNEPVLDAYNESKMYEMYSLDNDVVCVIYN